MARPQKQPDHRRSERVIFRVTPEGKARLQAKAAQAGLSLGDYSRQAAEGAQITARESRADFALTNQIRRLGVTVNQIARRVNAGGRPPAYLDRLCARIETVLERLFDEDRDRGSPRG